MTQLESLLTLAATAEKMSCSINEVVGRGSYGELILVARIPEHFQVCLASHAMDLERPPFMREPAYLELTPNHCRELLQTEMTDLTQSRVGYITNEGHVRMLVPSSIRPHSDPLDVVDYRIPAKWILWQITKDDKPFKAEININRISVLQRSVLSIIRKDFDGPIDRKGAFNSDLLQMMKRAAAELWGSELVIENDRSTHPSPQQVALWLMRKMVNDNGTCRISESMARDAAAILRPQFSFEEKKYPMPTGNLQKPR